jgi:hypothetical protein
MKKRDAEIISWAQIRGFGALAFLLDSVALDAGIIIDAGAQISVRDLLVLTGAVFKEARSLLHVSIYN